MVLGELLLFPSCQPHTQLGSNLGGDVLLYRKDVSKLVAMLLAPDLSAVSNIHQLGTEVQIVAPLNQPTREDRTDVQLASHSNGVRVTSFVAKYRTPSHDPQFGQVREAIDDVLGYAVAYIFGFRVRIGVDQRQNREGCD